jgi:hypothetical protein
LGLDPEALGANRVVDSKEPSAFRKMMSTAT